ncbi:hypothetical protein EDD90_3303 [Streptomyces sp. Ag109_O5-1]|uniref:hypothetical protein n=1 Tax=Streptomyces sp. Ag109_O5-1 TaxID=1938851 RepID=UPI000F511056|nr:hypothetical protein [Streptomyces sp. Ag109_O5-1]RPE40267.1 hypothetical protein EDD90_3303 [Streptomyces sp. Ag109_O5-1]
MAGMYGLGRVYNVIPIAAGNAFKFRGASACSFVCTGNDTFTLTASATFGGSYASPGNIITRKVTNTATNGTAAWVDATQSGSNAVTISSGTVVFTVLTSQIADPLAYLKVSVGASGLVTAFLHDLTVQRKPANLEILGA